MVITKAFVSLCYAFMEYDDLSGSLQYHAAYCELVIVHALENCIYSLLNIFKRMISGVTSQLLREINLWNQEK